MRGRTAKAEEKARLKQGGRNRKKRKYEDSTEDIGVGVNVDVDDDEDTIHRSRSTASIRSLWPLRPRFEDFDLPF